MKRYLCFFIISLSIVIVGAGMVFATDDPIVKFKERTQEGNVTDLPPGKNWYNVDINSFIDVTFSPENLDLSFDKVTSTEKVDRLKEEIDRLNQMLEAGHENLTVYAVKIKNLREQYLKNPSPKLEKQFWEALEKHDKIINQIITYLNQRVTDGKLEESKLENALNQVLMKGDKSYGDLLDLLSKDIKGLQKELTAEIDQILQQNQMMMNVWCLHETLGSQPKAVHLVNYDDLASGELNFVKKVSFSLSNTEIQNLKEGYEKQQKLVQMLDKFSSKNDDLSDIFNEIKARIKKEFEEYKDLLDLPAFQKFLTDLGAELEKLTGNQEFQTMAAQINQMLQTIKDEVDLVNDYSDYVKGLIGGNLGPEDLLTAVEKTKTLVKTLKEKNLDYDQLHQRIIELSTKMSDEPKLKSQLSELKTWITKAPLLTIEKLSNNGEIISDFQSAISGVLPMLNLTAKMGDVKDSEDLEPSSIKTVDFSKAPDTIIPIPTTSRKEKDVYTLHIKLTQGDQSLLTDQYSFQVYEYGLSNAFKSSLIFARDDGQNSFQPATSISMIFHYRFKNVEEKIGREVYDFVNPGFGLNAAVFTGSDSTSYGLAGSVTFANDLLQIGYGVKLQGEDGGTGYFFIGTSLLDLLQNPASQMTN